MASILKGEAALARKLHAQKETTGRIINHPPSEAYKDGWDRVFGKREHCDKCDDSGLVESSFFKETYEVCACVSEWGAERHVVVYEPK
jgi:hypothetical protein